jgi:glycosyltransferase involved in cell wall biosynthesis
MAKRKWLWIRFPKKNLSVITVSKYAEIEIKNHLPLKNVPFQPIYHGFNSTVFFADNAVQRTFFLHVSAYQKKKNVENIIEAYKDIPKEKKVPLVLVVPNFPPCESIDGIEIIRIKQSPDEIADLMRKAMAFVFPSFHESFGMPLIEAMACGCPIITSNITACPEIVDNAAILVNPNEIKELKNALSGIIENPILRADLSQKSLKRATQFSWEKTAREHLSFFKKLNPMA